jgi:hypothetical protein
MLSDVIAAFARKTSMLYQNLALLGANKTLKARFFWKYWWSLGFYFEKLQDNHEISVISREKIDIKLISSASWGKSSASKNIDYFGKKITVHRQAQIDEII